MWRQRRCLVILLCLAAGATLRAQEGSQPLTVWIVRPVTAADRAVERAQKDLRDISVYRESTSGDFGTASSNVGQTAGSYGKPASEAGTNASNVGQTAGSYGQTASSLPGNVPSQTAGSYGQTAGSFGTNASDFNGAPRPTSAAATGSTVSRDSKGTRWPNFLSELHDDLPGLDVRFVEVNGTDLRARLAAPGPLGGAPDVLLSDRMPDWWPAAMSSGATVLLLGSYKSPLRHTVSSASGDGERRQTVYREAYALVRAPHPAAAHAFLLWWYDRAFPAYLAPGEARVPPSAQPAATIAQAAVSVALDGGPLDPVADAHMAEFSTAVARDEALGPQRVAVAGDLQLHTDVLTARANAHFAAVLLHTHLESRSAVGELYPVVLLRTDDHGAWKVLHLSLEGGPAEAQDSFKLASAEAHGGQPVTVGMPVLAAPVDGDQRAARSGLTLAWDNDTGASLLIIEWQAGAHHPVEPSHLLLLQDTDGRQRTEVPAPFTDLAGPVRWRVWAMGTGGAAQITGWRTVTMVP